MAIDKTKLIIAVQNLLEDEMIDQEDVPTIQSWIDNRNYANLYGRLKWELAGSDIYYSGEISY
jgi:hypothetical protein